MVPTRRLSTRKGKAPDFELLDTDKRSHKLSSKKKILLINFWEIWCSPCRESIPKIKALLDKYPTDFEVLSIVSDNRTFDKIHEFKAKMELNYFVLFGNQETSRNYLVTAVPLYVVVDKNGIIQHAQYGYTDNIESVIAEYMKL